MMTIRYNDALNQRLIWLLASSALPDDGRGEKGSTCAGYRAGGVRHTTAEGFENYRRGGSCKNLFDADIRA